ncbi:hypothetical protein [uncultured Flavobacterium sp.]|uniref:hypothetical protein n=1 Tax=uncultured Flavobacterium sp. TaxID=165435 RepID=UPI0025E62832|nr:hypothetical protein [uncultured Flavobacterium sp.]
MTKSIFIKLFLFLLVTISQKSFSQEFYVTNLSEIITDENLKDNQLAKLNKSYLSKKGFELVTDSLAENFDTKEKIKLSSEKRNNFHHLTISYFTLGKNLEKFRTRLQDKKMNFTKISPNLYEQKYKTSVAKIEILKDSSTINQSYYLIKSSLIYEKSSFNKKYIFRLKPIYPLQNTTWYFDLNYTKSQGYSDKNIIEVLLKKDISNYKIDFIDDIHYIITFVDAKKVSRKLTGTYDNDNGEKIHFHTDYVASEIEPKSKSRIKYMQEERIPPVDYIEIEKLNKLKNTIKYFEFFFNHSFQILESTNKITLNTSVYSNENVPDIAPKDRR